MLGILIGTVCLIGLIKTLRWGRHRHAWAGGYGGGCGSAYGGGCGSSYRGYGRHGWGGHRDHGYGDGGWGGPGAMLRGLFRRLDTTPGQEKVIVQAFEELREAARQQRGELRSSRADVAKAMREPSFDAVLFGEMFGRHDAALEAMRKAAIGALAKVHDVLDEKQRARLAEMIESGPGFFRGGPFAEASL
jgi:Spy/CpxP family protein refolding chaperone